VIRITPDLIEFWTEETIASMTGSLIRRTTSTAGSARASPHRLTPRMAHNAFAYDAVQGPKPPPRSVIFGHSAR
jgi:hypothetical protein